MVGGRSGATTGSLEGTRWFPSALGMTRAEQGWTHLLVPVQVSALTFHLLVHRNHEASPEPPPQQSLEASHLQPSLDQRRGRAQLLGLQPTNQLNTRSQIFRQLLQSHNCLLLIPMELSKEAGISPAVLALLCLLFNQSSPRKTHFATQMSPRGALSHLSVVQVPFPARSLA